MSAGAVVAAEPALSQGRTGQPQNCRGRRVACGLAAAAVAGCRLNKDAEAGLPWKNLGRRSVTVDVCYFSLAQLWIRRKIKSCMKKYAKILFSILAAVVCATAFAADQPACKKSGKNCPMNNGKECNCGKSCDC